MANDYSSIQAIDFSLGVWLNDCFSQDNSKVHGTEAFKRLLAREPADKISRASIFDVQAIIKSLEGGSSRAVDSDVPLPDVKANSVALPIIHYGRHPNIIVPESNAADEMRQIVELESGEKADIYMRKISVPYQVFFIANDIPTLDFMQLAFLRFASNNRKFDTKYTIDGESLDGITCTIEDTYNIAYEDASVDRSERRLFAVSFPLLISAYSVSGAVVDVPDTIRWILELDHCAPPFNTES